MVENNFYTDACCKHQRNIGSWAVVQGEKKWSGVIHTKHHLRSGYCELYAIKQALLLANNDNVTIFNDNPCAELLNSSREHIHMKLTKSKYKDKELLREVYELYRSMPNVKIKKIGRKNNRVADKLARKTLKMRLDYG